MLTGSRRILRYRRSQEKQAMLVFTGSGEVREGLAGKFLHKFQAKRFYGSSTKSTTTLLFRVTGCNVNLGNIALSEVISLEAMRIGLRGDTLNYTSIKNRRDN